MRRALLPFLLSAMLLGGCGTLPGAPDGEVEDDDPELNQPTGRVPVTPGRAASAPPFEEGMAAYEAGRFDAAINAFNRAIDQGRLTTAQQLEARKHIAFALCATRRTTLCRKEFREILRIDPTFSLSRAEAGHPAWGPAFAAVRKTHQSGRR